MTHTGGQSASAKCEQDCIDAIEPIEELKADGARAFTGVEVFAVLHEKRFAIGCDLPGTLARILDVSLDQFDCRAEPTDPVDFRDIGACARNHRDTDSACVATICERLPEIASACADGAPWTLAFCET